MFNLIEKSKGYLFASNDLRAMIENQRAALRQEVEQMDANRLLNTAPADLYITNCSFPVISINGAMMSTG